MKRYISAILIPCLLFCLGGCTSSHLISRNEFKSEEKKDVTLTTYRDKELTLSADEYTVFKDTIIIPAYNKKIPLSEIKKITVDEIDVAIAATLIGGVVLVIAFIAGAANSVEIGIW